MAQSDLELIHAHAQALIDIANSPNPPGCGGKSTDHCKARRMMIELGMIRLDDYEKKNIGERSKPAIKRIQAAVGAVVDGFWGPETSGKLAKALQDGVGYSVAVNVPVVTKPGETPPESETGIADKTRPPPGVPEPGIVDRLRFKLAGIPWIVPVGLLAAAAAGWFFYRRGKANGLSGCSCASMGSHEDHDHDEESPEMAEMVQGLRQIPAFQTPRAVRHRGPTKVARQSAQKVK